MAECYVKEKDGLLRKWNKEVGDWEYVDVLHDGPGVTLVDKYNTGAVGSSIELQNFAVGAVGGSPPMSTHLQINYKYNEAKYLREIHDYIDGTYDQHYSKNNFQATEFIIDGGHGTGFCIGNVLKYAQRYGRKGTPEDWRKDLMKVIHYAIIQLHVHDLENSKGEKK